jgi:hypothetical protein
VGDRAVAFRRVTLHDADPQERGAQGHLCRAEL